jgi:nucleoside phosphorylase
MSELVIKTGMAAEKAVGVAAAARGTLVLSGIMGVADFHRVIPDDCEAILSLGLCGSLTKGAQIGQPILSSVLVTPDEEYPVDLGWRRRLFAATKFYEHRWLSTGEFNQANTPEQRAALAAKYHCAVIDDESAAVAQFCLETGRAFMAMRAVSDGWDDTVPPAAIEALNSNGSMDILEVLKSVVDDPEQLPDLEKMADQYYASLDTLRRACALVGPRFAWN